MDQASSHMRAFDVSHQMVLAIAIPMTLGLITVPIVGMVDMAVIGQLGDAALMGGIAIGALLFDVVAASCNFFAYGYNRPYSTGSWCRGQHIPTGCGLSCPDVGYSYRR